MPNIRHGKTEDAKRGRPNTRVIQRSLNFAAVFLKYISIVRANYNEKYLVNL